MQEKEGLKSKFFKSMMKIRLTEREILDLFSKGELSGTTHTCIGQEACAVGVVNSLQKDRDIIFSNHRNHGHYLAYNDDLIGLLAELMGKKDGVSGGIGGSQHIHKDNFYSSGIQAGLVPSAVGAALAEKEKDSEALVTVFIGDGTLGQGVVYESLNIASLWSLPILFVVEDNEYAQSTPSNLQHSGDLADRASPFDIESKEIEVNDVMQVHAVAKEGVSRVRQNKEPYFLVLHTYRFAPHSKGDDYRDDKEISKHKESDPLEKLKNELPNAFVREVKETMNDEIDEAVRAARQSEEMSYSEFREVMDL